MISKKAILKLLSEHDIPAVLIGGLAMRIYNSPRVTHDMDMAVRTLDIDGIIKLMFENGYYLATEADEKKVYFCTAEDEASQWIEDHNPGSMSFFYFEDSLTTPSVPISEVDITTEIDCVYEISIPFTQLYNNGTRIALEEIEIVIAAPEDLLYLKEQRTEKTTSDYADIEYLRTMLDG
jgi:hypothetical protein